MGRGEQKSELEAGLRRAGHERERTPLLDPIEGSFGDVIDYELLGQEGLAARAKYEELARGYKALADEAWIRYRQATELWVFCRAKARGRERQRGGREDAARLADALALR